jgi:hypothetical protein
VIKIIKDQSFKDMVNKIQQDYEFLSETEISDLCYFIRRMNTIGLNKSFSNDFRNNLKKKIQSLIESGRADIKFLSTTYFDLSLSSYDVDYIAKALSQMIQNVNDGELEPISIIQMLIATSAKKSISYNQLMLAEVICRAYKVHFNL